MKPQTKTTPLPKSQTSQSVSAAATTSPQIQHLTESHSCQPASGKRDCLPAHPRPNGAEPARPTLNPAAQTHGDMTIHVPMKFKRDRGRKQVIAPSGLEGPVVFNRGQAQQALVLALARAHRWSRMLERGEVQSINDLAAQQGVDPSLIGRTLRLATLAPDITQAILAGQEPAGLSLRNLTPKIPVFWGEQRMCYGFIACKKKVACENLS